MASLDIDDTIAAIASPPGSAQRGIVRVSGPATVACLDQCFDSECCESIDQQKTVDAIAGNLRLTKELTLPGRLLIWPTNRSYTRQPSAEFHTIGSPPLLQMALKTICDAGARIARPGEFTLRAFLSGRLDLTQAEAVLAVIDAKGQGDLRLSLEQLAGGLATPLTSIRNELIAILAELEAQLDFAEEDIEFISDSLLLGKLEKAASQLGSIINQISGRHVTEEKFSAVLTGLPNAGKSSLFNCLLGESKAIVTNVAGTTTDYVTGELEQTGIKINLIDTAGLESVDSNEIDSHEIRASAQDHRRQRVNRSDLRLLCIAADASIQAVEDLQSQIESSSRTSIVVLTQSDQPLAQHVEAAIAGLVANSHHVARTSSVTGLGVEPLKQKLFELAIESQTSESPIVESTLRRTSDSLASAAKSVKLAIHAASSGIGEELVAAEIRHALEHLGCVVGTIYTDDILDVVFGQFCIGK